MGKVSVPRARGLKYRFKNVFFGYRVRGHFNLIFCLADQLILAWKQIGPRNEIKLKWPLITALNYYLKI